MIVPPQAEVLPIQQTSGYLMSMQELAALGYPLQIVLDGEDGNEGQQLQIQEGFICSDALETAPQYVQTIPDMPIGIESCILSTDEGLKGVIDIQEGNAFKAWLLTHVLYPDNYGATPIPENPQYRENILRVYFQNYRILENGEQVIDGPYSIIFDLEDSGGGRYNALIDVGGSVQRRDFNEIVHFARQIGALSDAQLQDWEKHIHEILTGTYRFKEGDNVPPEYIGMTSQEINAMNNSLISEGGEVSAAWPLGTLVVIMLLLGASVLASRRSQGKKG